MICPSCSADLEDGLAFCTRCRIPQPASGVVIAPAHPVLALVEPEAQPVLASAASAGAAPLPFATLPPVPEPGNGLAVTGIVLGAIGILSPVLSLAGLILALVARSQRQRLATAAVITSALGLVVSITLLVALLVLLGSPLEGL